MIINTPKESDFQLKQEVQSTIHEKAKDSSSSSSSQWLKLKDPRIVRVSRAFGGKDRHSKVFTIRGLRDRRVRLSVPTAIHLYDLQDRLGLNQPSKVVDWLLNIAKDEIDELPPLPIAPENFTLGYPSLSINNNNNTNDVNQIWKSKSKQVLGEMFSISEEEDKHVVKRCREKSAGNCGNSSSEHVLSNNMLPIGLLNTMPLGYQLEHFSGDVSHFANLGFVNQIGDIQHGINVVPFPTSSLSLSTGNSNTTNASSQILVCPSGLAQPYFPSHVATMEMDPRQINQYHQMVMSSSNQSNSLDILPQHLMRMTTPKLFHSPNNGESHSHRDQDFPSK